MLLAVSLVPNVEVGVEVVKVRGLVAAPAAPPGVQLGVEAHVEEVEGLVWVGDVAEAAAEPALHSAWRRRLGDSLSLGGGGARGRAAEGEVLHLAGVVLLLPALQGEEASLGRGLGAGGSVRPGAGHVYVGAGGFRLLVTRS